MQHARPTRLRRAVVYAALATLLGIVSLTLSQCTLVGDNLTGVDLSRGRPTTCIKQCNDFYKLVYDQEQKAHDQYKLLCDAVNCAALPNDCTACAPTSRTCCQAYCIDYRQACQAAEAARHAAEMDRITQAKTDCQNNCHRQGTGSAG